MDWDKRAREDRTRSARAPYGAIRSYSQSSTQRRRVRELCEQLNRKPPANLLGMTVGEIGTLVADLELIARASGEE